MKITYGELEDEMSSEVDSGDATESFGKAPKFPLVTRSKKSKEVPKHKTKHKVYTRKETKGLPPRKKGRIGSFVLEIPTI